MRFPVSFLSLWCARGVSHAAARGQLLLLLASLWCLCCTWCGGPWLVPDASRRQWLVTVLLAVSGGALLRAARPVAPRTVAQYCYMSASRPSRLASDRCYTCLTSVGRCAAVLLGLGARPSWRGDLLVLLRGRAACHGASLYLLNCSFLLWVTLCVTLLCCAACFRLSWGVCMGAEPREVARRVLSALHLALILPCGCFAACGLLRAGCSRRQLLCPLVGNSSASPVTWLGLPAALTVTRCLPRCSRGRGRGATWAAPPCPALVWSCVCMLLAGCLPAPALAGAGRHPGAATISVRAGPRPFPLGQLTAPPCCVQLCCTHVTPVQACVYCGGLSVCCLLSSLAPLCAAARVGTHGSHSGGGCCYGGGQSRAAQGCGALLVHSLPSLSLRPSGLCTPGMQHRVGLRDLPTARWQPQGDACVCCCDSQHRVGLRDRSAERGQPQGDTCACWYEPRHRVGLRDLLTAREQPQGDTCVWGPSTHHCVYWPVLALWPGAARASAAHSSIPRVGGARACLLEWWADGGCLPCASARVYAALASWARVQGRARMRALLGSVWSGCLGGAVPRIHGGGLSLPCAPAAAFYAASGAQGAGVVPDCGRVALMSGLVAGLSWVARCYYCFVYVLLLVGALLCMTSCCPSRRRVGGSEAAAAPPVAPLGSVRFLAVAVASRTDQPVAAEGTPPTWSSAAVLALLRACARLLRRQRPAAALVAAAAALTRRSLALLPRLPAALCQPRCAPALAHWAGGARGDEASGSRAAVESLAASLGGVAVNVHGNGLCFGLAFLCSLAEPRHAGAFTDALFPRRRRALFTATARLHELASEAMSALRPRAGQLLTRLLGDYDVWDDFVHRLSRSRAASVADGGAAGSRVQFTYEEYCDQHYSVPFALWGTVDTGLALAEALSQPVIMLKHSARGGSGCAYLPEALLAGASGACAVPSFVMAAATPGRAFAGVYRMAVSRAQLPGLVDWLCEAQCPPAITWHDGGAHFWSVMVARVRCPAWRPPAGLARILDDVFAASDGPGTGSSAEVEFARKLRPVRSPEGGDLDSVVRAVGVATGFIQLHASDAGRQAFAVEQALRAAVADLAASQAGARCLRSAFPTGTGGGGGAAGVYKAIPYGAHLRGLASSLCSPLPPAAVQLLAVVLDCPIVVVTRSARAPLPGLLGDAYFPGAAPAAVAVSLSPSQLVATIRSLLWGGTPPVVVMRRGVGYAAVRPDSDLKNGASGRIFGTPWVRRSITKAEVWRRVQDYGVTEATAASDMGAKYVRGKGFAPLNVVPGADWSLPQSAARRSGGSRAQARGGEGGSARGGRPKLVELLLHRGAATPQPSTWDRAVWDDERPVPAAPAECAGLPPLPGGERARLSSLASFAVSTFLADPCLLASFTPTGGDTWPLLKQRAAVQALCLRAVRASSPRPPTLTCVIASVGRAWCGMRTLTAYGAAVLGEWSMWAVNRAPAPLPPSGVPDPAIATGGRFSVLAGTLSAPADDEELAAGAPADRRSAAPRRPAGAAALPPPPLRSAPASSRCMRCGGNSRAL